MRCNRSWTSLSMLVAAVQLFLRVSIYTGPCDIVCLILEFLTQMVKRVRERLVFRANFLNTNFYLTNIYFRVLDPSHCEIDVYHARNTSKLLYHIHFSTVCNYIVKFFFLAGICRRGFIRIIGRLRKQAWQRCSGSAGKTEVQSYFSDFDIHSQLGSCVLLRNIRRPLPRSSQQQRETQRARGRQWRGGC